MNNAFYIVFTASIVFCTLVGYSQKKLNHISCDSVKNAQDCASAIPVVPVRKMFVQCTPEGFGNKLEFKTTNKADLYCFYREHNSVWFKLTSKSDGIITFTIKPKDMTYDYDFLLFKAEGQNTCNRIMSKNLKPIRSNISRYDIAVESETGLSMSASSKFAHSGPGSHMSKSVNAKKNEIYYLAIDNVNGGSSGFSIDFNTYKLKEVSGTIVDDNSGEPIEADVTWEDGKTGQVLAKTRSNKKGEYKFKVPYNPVSPLQYYMLTAFNDNHFFAERKIYSKKFHSDKPIPIKLVMASLKAGSVAKFQSINFYGNSTDYLPSAKRSLKRLYKIMKKNRNLYILIEGHTNGCQQGSDFSQTLSDGRANTVKNFLTDHKIDIPRIKTKGFGCRKMLFKHPNTEHQSSMNRRVEIKVLKNNK